MRFVRETSDINFYIMICQDIFYLYPKKSMNAHEDPGV